MTNPGKPAAQSFSAGINKEVGASPLHWNDKCFLCGVEIGETDPRQFYNGKASMMLCHTGCLNVMNANGGKPADYHRAMGDKAVKAVGLDPGSSYTGPGWLEFPNMTALVSYIKDRGEIPSHVKVTIGNQVVQVGE